MGTILYLLLSHSVVAIAVFIVTFFIMRKNQRFFGIDKMIKNERDRYVSKFNEKKYELFTDIKSGAIKNLDEVKTWIVRTNI